MIRFISNISGLGLIVLSALALPVWAGENIVLRTGSTLPADRHEVDGGTIRIYSGDGVTELAVSLVARVEIVETPADTAPAAPAPVAPAPVAPAAEVTASAPAPEPEAALPAVPELTPRQLAEAAALKYALPAAFVSSVMRAESNFNPAALSPKGAIGLMQLMPGTARDLGVDPNKPAENAEAGARYLHDLLAKYEDRPDQVQLALAAYNAGTAAVDKYHGVPPYRETREYIIRVLKDWNPTVSAPVPAASQASQR
jgi:soluble lytic murein transglycosylase-like protein